MKAAVMESEKGKSIILTEDGEFAEIEGSYEPGQIIEYKKWKPAVRANKSFRSIVAVACLVLTLLIAGPAITGPASYACVELGDGYSVRYLLDEDLKVIEVEASEESGRELADSLKSDGVKGKDINEAITMAEELTGRSYDAAAEPPKVKCRNDSEGKNIENEILERHSDIDKTECNDLSDIGRPEDSAGAEQGAEAGPVERPDSPEYVDDDKKTVSEMDGQKDPEEKNQKK